MAAGSNSTQSIRLSNWIVRPDINRILGPAGNQRVGKRTMETLLFLIKHEGQAVTKEQLFENVWSDVVVTEDSITKSISTLRQVFKHEGEEFPKIDTVRGIGYVFSSPIEYLNTNMIGNGGLENGRAKHTAYFVLGLVIVSVLIGTYLFKFFQPQAIPGRLVSLTDDWNQERVPRISPDGKKVIYASGEEGWNNLNISVKNINTNEATKLAEDDYLKTDPIWSPDGNQIAFFRNDGKEVFLIQKDLSTLKEKALTQVSAIVNLSAMVWSADGQWIIYCDFADKCRISSLHKINIVTGQKKQLTFPEGKIVGDLSPRLSPSGNQLAFIRSAERSAMHYNLIPGRGKICIQNVRSGEVEEVLSVEKDLSGISWIDDEHIAYATNYDSNNFRIYQFNIITHEQILITESQNLIRNLDLHPETKRLVFESWNEHYGIWKYTSHNKTTNFTNRLLKDDQNNWQPRIHHSNGALVYISAQSGHTELWLKDSLHKTSVQLTHFDGPIIRNPSWSPDGKHIVFEIHLNGQDDVYQVNTIDKEISLLLTSPFDEKYPSWSESGLHLYYGSNKSGQFEIWKKPIDSTKTTIQVTQKGGLRGQEKNGALYFTKPYDHGIWRSIQYKEELVIKQLNPYDLDNWAMGENSLYYIRRNQFWAPQMYLYDLATGTDQHYLSFNMPISFAFSGIAVDPKTNTLMVTHNDKNKADIKMLYHEIPSPVVRSMSYVSNF